MCCTLVKTKWKIRNEDFQHNHHESSSVPDGFQSRGAVSKLGSQNYVWRNVALRQECAQIV